MRLLNVSKRVDYLALNTMYNIFHNSAPSYMCTLDLVNHCYNTRGRNISYYVPKGKGQCSKSFKFGGAKLWNNLPLFIKEAKSKDDFKIKCKGFLMQQMQL